LVKRIAKKIKEVKLLRVINLDVYYERLEQGIDPEKEAEETLSFSRKKFLDEYISDKLIYKQILIGIPSEGIIKEIKENDYDLVLLGRRGRSPLKDLIMGGVSSAVIYNCKEPTIVIINL
ncbi:MAG: universal stress protein, partial [Thermodesulfobacterium sp.]|nr:universal stress protein [Thermodesulfobacterium sp.]